MLRDLTLTVNFIALLTTLWLGLYLVTLNPRRPVILLSALALWSMGGFFFNQLLALNPPPTPPTKTLIWLEPLLFFWPKDVFALGWKGWIEGWLPTPAIIFWFHATLYILPGKFDFKRRSLALAGYCLAAAGVFIQIFFNSLYVTVSGDPLYINALQGGPLFPVFELVLGLFAVLGAHNLLLAFRLSPTGMPRTQFRLMIFATLFAGATALLALATNLFNIRIPTVLVTIFMGLAVLLTGVSVARYNALLDRRAMRKDFLYNLAQTAAAVAIYLLFYWSFTQLYPLPAFTFVFVGCLAVISHSLVDLTRFQLDRLFYYGKSHHLRLRMRQLYNISEKSDIREVLELALEVLGDVSRVTWAIVLRYKPGGLETLAAWNWKGMPIDEIATIVNPDILRADDVMVLRPKQLAPPLERAALLVPLYNQEQIGALLLGRSQSRAGYSEAELGTLLYHADYLEELILRFDYDVGTLANMEETALLPAQERIDQYEDIPPRQIELALRNLHDYSYLADTLLANMRLVRKSLDNRAEKPYTHIDTGKAVANLLIEAIEKLRPDPGEPRKPLPRTWYPYIILRDAYLAGEPNRDIITRLYISEGTFNRTRRAAIRSVARMLQEMEVDQK